jgi:phosphate acetyltransferase
MGLGFCKWNSMCLILRHSYKAMFKLIADLGDNLQDTARRVLFPENLDQRVIEAVRQFSSAGFGVPVLLSQAKNKTENIEVFSDSPDVKEWTERCVESYFQLRGHKGITAYEARNTVENNPLLLGALLVRLGFVDAGVAGSMASTADVVRAGIQGVGLDDDCQLLSSFFLMQLTDRVVAYADCGVNPDPGPQELAQISIATASSYQRLTGEEPVVALLSFSTKGSAQHPHVDKVKAALGLVQEMQPNLLIDGELQFDAAFVPEVAASKAQGSPVAGSANVFIFPNLDAGNIAYKITQYIGGAIALGPLLQGLSKPWMDLSRGCSVQDIVDVSVIAATLSID